MKSQKGVSKMPTRNDTSQEDIHKALDRLEESIKKLSELRKNIFNDLETSSPPSMIDIDEDLFQ